jgi:hypothetical protein
MTEREMSILFGETLPTLFPSDSSDEKNETACSLPQEMPSPPLQGTASPPEMTPLSPLPVLVEVTREEECFLFERSSSRSNGRGNAFLQRLLAASELFSGTSPTGARNRG